MHAGSFFFSRLGSAERSDGTRVILTLVLQLVEAFSGLKELVEKVIARTQLFSRGRVNRRCNNSSLAHFTYSPPIVKDLEIQKDLLRVIASAFPLLPFPLRFLISSRPESHLLATFNHDLSLLSIECHRINLEDEPQSANDIRKFSQQEFKQIHRTHPLRESLDPNWPSKDAIEHLVTKSSSQFISISTAMKYIQYPRGVPDEDLKIVLGLTLPPNRETPFAELDALYSYILGSLSACQLLWLRSKKCWTCEEASWLLLDPILSLVYMPTGRTEEPRLYHASLFDYLRHSHRSGDFELDLSLAYETIARHWMMTFQGTRVHYSASEAGFFGTHSSVLGPTSSRAKFGPADVVKVKRRYEMRLIAQDELADAAHRSARLFLEQKRKTDHEMPMSEEMLKRVKAEWEIP
ncbi:hypothetical protein CPB83DRAFT_830659 [Crepidotus variabilis]|uniref:Uncharacterized protein n=1 Tax=Crepidotus variabilis TaxID=179855 RepID=A0A9P6EUU7_9AGAR|nr:hypothetical protein CPB83DRAFT_830659 [Crepidotus variabilis]